MATVTVRNLPDETHRALLVRSATHGRSTEAEIRAILESAVNPEGRVKLGTLLAEIGREVGGIDLEIERDKTPTEAELTVEDGALVLRQPANPPRSGWGEASQALAEAGDDALLLPEFAHEMDEELVW